MPDPTSTAPLPFGEVTPVLRVRSTDVDVLYGRRWLNRKRVDPD